MINLFGFNNVFYELSSDYEFSELNESLYVENIFKNLTVLMGKEFNKYDFFIFSNHKLDTEPKSLAYTSSKRKVLLYLSDEFNKDPSHISKYYYAIFKAYLGSNKLGNNIFPLGIGYVKDVPKVDIIPINQRKYNVFFSGNLNKNRIDFYRSFISIKAFLPSQRILNSIHYRAFLIMLKSNFSNFFANSIISFNSSFKSGFTTIEYGNLLADSKIILSPKGYDRTECFRLYEAMRVGCAIISEKLPDIYFYRDSPIIQVTNWKEGITIINDLVGNPSELNRLQTETINWWNERCSERAMASYIISILELIDNNNG